MFSKSKTKRPKVPKEMKPYHEVFGEYEIASHEPLEGLKRSKCSKCGQSRMYFCYKCRKYVETVDESKMPKVPLPWKMDIIKHAKEVDGKSTAIHAALLCPEDVKIYTYPTIPDYPKVSNILLVFPDKKALTLEEVFGAASIKTDEKRNTTTEESGTPAKMAKLESLTSDQDDMIKSPDSKFAFDKIAIIDCTWSQAYSISTDERIKHLRTVKLSDLKTVYWRHNEDMPYTFLATIEAIYSFLKVTHKLMHGCYDGRYDNLLYFYSYFYKLVQRGTDKSKNSAPTPQKNDKIDEVQTVSQQKTEA